MTGPGSLLPPPALADFTQAMHHESFWVRRLTRMRPLRLPIDEEPAAVEAIGVDIPSWVSDDVTIAAAALAYLGEVTGESGFSVGLRVVPQSDLLASVVPLEVPERSEEVPLRLARTVDRGSYLRDVVARYPALRARDLSMPVVLDLTNSTTPLEVPLTIHVYRGGCSFVATEGLARSLAGGFGAFLEWLPTAGARRAPLVSAAEYEWQVWVATTPASSTRGRRRCTS